MSIALACPIHWGLKMKLDLLRTIQASRVLLNLEPGQRSSYMRLLKLLYLADREMISETGSPITYDRTVAMKHGPVLSETYNLIKGEHVDAALWNRFVQKDEYTLSPTGEEPGRDRLSRLAVSILTKVSEEHKQYDDWQLVDHLHATLPEWGENWPGENCNTSIPVSFEAIFGAIGMDPEDTGPLIAELNAERSRLSR